METSHLLARIFGVAFVVIYTGLLLNPKQTERILRDLRDLPIVLFLSGFISLILGLVVVAIHPIWTWDWRSLITFFGWFMILQGTIRLLAPQLTMTFAEKMYRNASSISYASGVMVVIGLFLLYMGFWG